MIRLAFGPLSLGSTRSAKRIRRSRPTKGFDFMEPWARIWNVWIGSTFLSAYLQHAQTGNFLPTNREELDILLNVYLFEKALYELGYELNNRPDWVRIPLTGILQLLQSPEAA